MERPLSSFPARVLAAFIDRHGYTVEELEAIEQELAVSAEKPWWDKCACKSTGMLSTGEYCKCEMGKTLKRLAGVSVKPQRESAYRVNEILENLR